MARGGESTCPATLSGRHAYRERAPKGPGGGTLICRCGSRRRAADRFVEHARFAQKLVCRAAGCPCDGKRTPGTPAHELAIAEADLAWRARFTDLQRERYRHEQQVALERLRAARAKVVRAEDWQAEVERRVAGLRDATREDSAAG